MTYNLNDVVDELFESFISRYQIGLKTSMRGSNFVFNSVQLLIKNVTKYILKVVDHI